MAAINNITGDTIQTKGASQAYRDNYDAIFRRVPQSNPDWPESAERRIDIIGQNGNTGEHYETEK